MDQDLKHQCRLCHKSFSCGRSLGGHMRSHVASTANANAKGDDVVDYKKEKKAVQASRVYGYGLRENPKKTWRLMSDSAKSFDLGKDCGECGKVFQSWKALFGHMRCHYNKNSKEVLEEGEDGGVAGSWSGGSHSPLIEMKMEVPRKKRRSRRSVSVSASASSSSPLACYSKEQEDVAIGLMMLSRDVGFGFSHFAESSDKNSAVFNELGNSKNKEWEFNDVSGVDYDDGIKKLQADHASDSDYFDFVEKFDDSVKKKKIGLDWIDPDVKKISIAVDSKSIGEPKSKRSKYECATYNKSFNTHQALGGHRASHKRMKGACFVEINHLEIDQMVVNKVDEKMKGNHQCLIWGKVFSSGQALGGHKRSHFVVASPSVGIQQDSIDFNLPTQVEDDSSKGSVSVIDAEYDSWWDAGNLQREAMVGMIAN